MNRWCAIGINRAAKYFRPHYEYKVLTTHQAQSGIESEGKKYPVSDTYGNENARINVRGSEEAVK
jgi:hypothetical protein